MRCSLTLSLLLALAAPALAQVPGGAEAFERELTDLSQHARARTVLIYGVVGLGSGAVIDHQGTIVTNAHVVAGARYAIVEWADGRSLLTRRLGIDYGRDLAVLRPVDPLKEPVPAFSLAGASPQVGEWVLAAGFPGGLRTTNEPTISLGQILKPSAGGVAESPGGVLDYGAALRSDLAIFSGNSGGPMIDRAGRLAGINGAVDLENAVSLTIPIEVVRKQLDVLKGGVIVLPGDQVLQTESGLLRGFYRATDRMARQLPERAAQASRQAAKASQRTAAPSASSEPNSPGLTERALTLPRQKALAACAGDHGRALVADEGLLLTQVAPTYAVCKASLLGERRSLRMPSGVANVVATSEADDLALVRLPQKGSYQQSDAPHRPVGSLVFARGPKGLLASGMLSAPARPTSAAVLAGIQAGGAGAMGPVLRILEGMAKATRSRPLRQLAEQIRNSIRTRSRFSAGTPPRSYREVISVDAPIPPARMGAPVEDREGRLLGVAVGVAHHGTAYVVPMARVRAAFRDQLGGQTRPARRGKARLF